MEGGISKAEGPRRALQRGTNAAGKWNSGWQHLLCGQDSKQAAAEVGQEDPIPRFWLDCLDFERIILVEGTG